LRQRLYIDLFKIDIEDYESPVFESWPKFTDTSQAAADASLGEDALQNAYGSLKQYLVHTGPSNSNTVCGGHGPITRLLLVTTIALILAQR
jgi:hypothetical protein